MYTIRLDYATFNFEAGTMSKNAVGETLAGMQDLCWRHAGMSINAPYISPMGLRWQENSGYSERPHKLEVSGVGCSHFFETLPLLRAAAPCHFSRLDFAFDVIMKRTEWVSFICDVFQDSLKSDRERKRYRIAGDGEAMTVYIGSRLSAKYFRIYNKTLEDPKYVFKDSEGNLSSVADDECVIRYEVELKRHKVVSKNEVRLTDPSPLFDAFYSGDPADGERLCKEIHSLWLSFGNEILLPEGFEDAKFSLFKQTEILFKKGDSEKAIDSVAARLHDYPHSFDHSLEYVVAKFGKYIPYILVDAQYKKVCFDECKIAFGFAPDIVIEQMDYTGKADLMELDDAEEVFSDYIQDTLFEGGVNPWL